MNLIVILTKYLWKIGFIQCCTEPYDGIFFSQKYNTISFQKKNEKSQNSIMNLSKISKILVKNRKIIVLRHFLCHFANFFTKRVHRNFFFVPICMVTKTQILTVFRSFKGGTMMCISPSIFNWKPFTIDVNLKRKHQSYISRLTFFVLVKWKEPKPENHKIVVKIWICWFRKPKFDAYQL